MKYIIVRVDQDYDYVEGVEYVDQFNTREECEQYVAAIKEKHEQSILDRTKYIDDFVDKIELPKDDGPNYDPATNTYAYTRWQNFLKTIYDGYASSYINHTNFHEDLKRTIMKGYGYKIEGCNPPQFSYSGYNLHIIELPEKIG